MSYDFVIAVLFFFFSLCFFFQAEDGIRDLVQSRGLGDVYKRQDRLNRKRPSALITAARISGSGRRYIFSRGAMVAYLSLIHI